MLDPILRNLGAPLNLIINLEVPDEVILSRIAGTLSYLLGLPLLSYTLSYLPRVLLISPHHLPFDFPLTCQNKLKMAH